MEKETKKDKEREKDKETKLKGFACRGGMSEACMTPDRDRSIRICISIMRHTANIQWQVLEFFVKACLHSDDSRKPRRVCKLRD